MQLNANVLAITFARVPGPASDVGSIAGLLTFFGVAVPAESPTPVISNSEEITIGNPRVTDGPACWQLAAATGVLDVNSRYAYLLWFRDFTATSVVARSGGEVVGFISGYRRPQRPSTLMVWQVAVAEVAQGRGVATAMLDALYQRVPCVDAIEATITPGNGASIGLFTRFAERWGAAVARRVLFGAELLGAGHEPEILFRIGPIHRRPDARTDEMKE
jgi:L-2,4-diaminobutyric acid acetyltransferase